MPQRLSLAAQMAQVQARLVHIDQLLRAAHRLDRKAVATLAQVAGTLEVVSAEIGVLMTNVAAHANGRRKKK